MKKLCLTLLSAVFALGGYCSEFRIVLGDTSSKAISHFPEFTWDTLQVCLHFSKSDADFSEEEVKFISQFPLICIEKTQARHLHGGADKGTEVAAQAIKAVNPKTKVLSYFNLNLDYCDLYSFGTMLGDGGPREDWRLYDKDGKVQKTTTRYKLDLSNINLRRWWVNTALEFSELKGVDGLFIDATTSSLNFPERMASKYGAQKAKEMKDGVFSILNTLESRSDKNKLIIGNGAAVIKGETREKGLELVSKLDGAMTEHFCKLSGEDKDEIVKTIELIDIMAKKKKVFVVKGWPRYDFTQEEIRKNKFTQSELEAFAREDITFPLACFLCGAGKYSYFCYSWGYRENQGSLVDYQEYHKPLGKPKGDYKRKGYIFTREFAHASVWVDVENKKATIDWK